MDYNASSMAILGIGFMFMFFFSLIFYIVAAIGLWKVFEKAGKPGWPAIVPVYNLIIWLEITGRPMLWLGVIIGLALLGYIIPFIGFIFNLAVFAVWIIMSIDLAKSFGKEPVYGVGIALLPFIFLPMLGFGDAQYHGANPLPLPLPEQFS